MSTKAQNVIEFYLICNKLKDTIRTGWQNWGVHRNRLESVAEHIYGTQMLAIAIHSEFDYPLDLKKILYMLAIHELGEALIGDYTPFEINQDEKVKLERTAVHKVLQNLNNYQEIEALFLEFDEHKPPEAKFAFMCDKLESDIQCKLYDNEHTVDLKKRPYTNALKNPEIQELLQNDASWSEIWLKYSQNHNNYDSNFQVISDYLLNS